MKKNIYLSCTRLRVYWMELPLILITALCFFYNSNSESLFKLYPLIITCIGAIIFIAIYFFRMIKVSYSEIRYIGRFSSHDKAVIKKDESLVIDITNRFRSNISLYGNSCAEQSGLDWLKNNNLNPHEINLFRGKFIGGKRAIKKILNFFGVSKTDFNDILKSKENFKKDYLHVSICTEYYMENKRIKIKINDTI